MDVRYCYNPISRLMQQARTDTADVTRALNHHARLGRRHPESLDGFVDHKQYSASGSFATAGRATQIYRLARVHRRNGVARVHGVSVHNPGHGLLVGVHVRSRHVLFWSNEVEQLGGITARHAFQLIQAASARTSSRLTSGAYRIPPLAGPRAKLCWTRKPSKT